MAKNLRKYNVFAQFGIVSIVHLLSSYFSAAMRKNVVHPTYVKISTKEVFLEFVNVFKSFIYLEIDWNRKEILDYYGLSRMIDINCS